MRHASQPFTWRDLMVLLFLAAVLSALGVRAIHAARDGGERIKCSSNLRQIGQGIQIYANANKGAFPRTTFDRSDAPVPTAYTGVHAVDPFGTGGPAPNDVTAGLFLILRDSSLDPGVFICPSSAQTPWDFGGGAAGQCSNFPNKEHLSYGYTNPYPSAEARTLGFKINWTLPADFPIAADMAPGPIVAQVPPDASPGQMRAANSRNHRGEGQCVLFADVHVDWSPTIFAGSPRPVNRAPRDNIYAFGVDLSPSAPSAGTDGPPVDQYDSVILPHAGLAVSFPSDERRTYWMLIVSVLAVVAVITTVILLLSRRKAAGPLPPSTPAP
jgi:hypothetical protein